MKSLTGVRLASAIGFRIRTTWPSHRRAVDADDARELRPDVLDDDFLVAHQFIDLHGDPALAATQQQDPVLPFLFGQRFVFAEQMGQVIEGVEAVEPRGMAALADFGQRVFLDVEHLLDHHRGDRVTLAADADQERLGDGEGQRNVEAKLGAFAGLG